MAPTVHQLVLLLAAVSFSLADVYYVSADRNDCPSGFECHSLSYYVSDPYVYFTSNTELKFTEGTHLLDSEKPIVVSYVSNLKLSGDGRWVTGPQETVMESTAVIYCVNGSGGFVFSKSSHITIYGLSLINCGTCYNESNVRFVTASHYATLFFIQMSVLTLKNISIQKSIGHGLIAYNCQSIEMNACSIAYSNIDYKSAPNDCSLQCNHRMDGSNSLFLYSSLSDIPTLTIFKSNFTEACGKGSLIFHAVNSTRLLSWFVSEVVILQKMSDSGDGIAVWTNMSAFSFILLNSKVTGSRKNIGMSIKTSASQATINIQNTVFADNSGGQLFLKSYYGSDQLELQVTNTTFLHQNVPKQAQYGVYILTKAASLRVIIQNITMSLGNAFMEGLVLKTSTTTELTTNEVYIKDSVFDSNGNGKSVLRLGIDTRVVIMNCLFTNNSGGGSVISVTRHKGLLMQGVTIRNNDMTTVSMWKGNLYFNGSNIIANNRNKHGAGVYLQGSSYMTVQSDSELIFLNNTAETVGGAIEVIDKRSFSDGYCSILVSDSSRILFSGNQAFEGGSDMYGARLVDCIDINHNRVPREGQPNETSWYFNIPRSHTMQFSNTDKLSSISTDPIMVCFCNEGGLPDCSKRILHHDRLFPGEETITEIATVGEYGGTSSGTVAINVHNATLVRPYGPQGTTARCLKLHLLLDSTHPTTAFVDIKINGGLPEWRATLVVDIMECPLGFSKNEQSGKCSCAPLFRNHNVSCIAVHNTSSFHRFGPNWFAFINNSRTCLTIYTSCPFDYCNSSLVIFNIRNPDNQCAGSRTGILCGQCQPGLSLLLGSNRCAQCSNVYLLLVLVFALAGIALVGVLMALNLTVSSGTVNSLLLYANMTNLNENVFFPVSRPPVVSQFISWLNLDFGIEVCLYDGLDGYWKTWLQFVFPAYLFILMGGIIVGSEYSVRICKLCGSHAVPALATLFLMSYTKILQAVTNALSMSQLDCNGTMLKVWSVDGNIDYFSGKHLILVIFSSCVLGAGVAYPLLVLFAPLLERYSGKCIPYKWNPVLKLKPLLDAYGGPYRDGHRYWTGVTLLVRLIVTILFSFTSGRLVFLNSIIIATTVQAFFFVWLFTRGVYRNLILNILNSLFLLNLFVLAVSSLAFIHLDLKNAQEVATMASTCLSLFGLSLIVIGHFLSRVKLTREKKSRSFTHLQNVISNGGGKENSSNSLFIPPGSPPFHVYGSTRGQNQFDLYLPNKSVFTPSNIDSPASPVLREREPLLFSTSIPKS